jgi:hypothetical protein
MPAFDPKELRSHWTPGPVADAGGTCPSQAGAERIRGFAASATSRSRNRLPVPVRRQRRAEEPLDFPVCLRRASRPAAAQTRAQAPGPGLTRRTAVPGGNPRGGLRAEVEVESGGHRTARPEPSGSGRAVRRPGPRGPDVVEGILAPSGELPRLRVPPQRRNGRVDRKYRARALEASCLGKRARTPGSAGALAQTAGPGASSARTPRSVCAPRGSRHRRKRCPSSWRAHVPPREGGVGTSPSRPILLATVQFDRPAFAPIGGAATEGPPEAGSSGSSRRLARQAGGRGVRAGSLPGEGRSRPEPTRPVRGVRTPNRTAASGTDRRAGVRAGRTGPGNRCSHLEPRRRVFAPGANGEVRTAKDPPRGNSRRRRRGTAQEEFEGVRTPEAPRTAPATPRHPRRRWRQGPAAPGTFASRSGAGAESGRGACAPSRPPQRRMHRSPALHRRGWSTRSRRQGPRAWESDLSIRTFHTPRTSVRTCGPGTIFGRSLRAPGGPRARD